LDVNIRELEIEDYDEVEEIWRLTDLFNSRDNKGRYEKILKQNKDLFFLGVVRDKILSYYILVCGVIRCQLLNIRE